MSSKAKRVLYLFLLPAALLYICFWVIPVLLSFYYGFTNWSGVGSYDFIGIKNFVILIKQRIFQTTLGNTLIYAGFSVIYGNILALTLALLLDMKLKLQKFYRTVFYLPTLFSTVVVGFIWGYVYAPYNGMIYGLFSLVGLAKYAPNFLANKSTALIAVAFVEKWKTVGTLTIIYLAGLQGIPEEVIESGKMDGCTGFGIIRHIKIPLLFNTITVNVILALISGLKVFDYVFLMTGGGPGDATNTLMLSVYKLAFVNNQYGMAEALAAMAFLFILIVTLIVLKFMNRKEIEA
jgi:ABC-type sugar transport system permease subunit